MKFSTKQLGILLSTAFLLSTFIVSAAFGFDDHGGPTRDSLGGLAKAIADAGAPSLTAAQITAINAAATTLKASIPTTTPTALTDAQTAYNTAILAGDLATAQAAAGVISGIITGQQNAHLIAEAKFSIDVITILKNGGQWSYLIQKFTSTQLIRVLDLSHGFGGGGREVGGR